MGEKMVWWSFWGERGNMEIRGFGGGDYLSCWKKINQTGRASCWTSPSLNLFCSAWFVFISRFSCLFLPLLLVGILSGGLNLAFFSNAAPTSVYHSRSCTNPLIVVSNCVSLFSRKESERSIKQQTKQTRQRTRTQRRRTECFRIQRTQWQ